MAKGVQVILDTCALLWLARGEKLTHPTLKEIREAPFIFVSAICGFEIAYKVGKGGLRLPKPPREWFDRVVEEHSLTVLSLDLEICVAAAQLPPIHHDPCDRFIIAMAKLKNLAVVTADERFEEYGVRTLL